jgi:hypothetical protein
VKTLPSLLMAAVFATIGPASAATYSYVNWNSNTSTSVSGTIFGSVNVAYTGEVFFVDQAGGFNYESGFNSVYTNSTVSNAPSDGNLIGIMGDPTFTNTVTFSSPVNHLIMDIVSLGGSAANTSYTFNKSFTILSQGPAYWGGPGTLQASNGNKTLTGIEGDGVILFNGPISSLTWTSASPENWNGFTFGADCVTPATNTPEPATWSAALLGLLIVGGRAVRRGR